MDELILVIDDEEELELQLDDDPPVDLKIGEEVVPIMIKNYDQLDNKPSINGVVLQGNKQFSDFLQNGLIIDGGTAEGAES